MSEPSGPSWKGAEPDAETLARAEELVKELDTEVRFRDLIGTWARIVTVLGVILSLFHVYTAGFGVLIELKHRAIHLAFVMGLIFLTFPMTKRGMTQRTVPWYDAILAVLAASWSIYILWNFDTLIHRSGEATPLDLAFGGLAIVMVLEATRRTMGWSLPLLGLLFLVYAYFGPYFPGFLAHRGQSVSRIIEHMYLSTEGIYGIPVGVVATYVFHFVLFGVFASRTGLGQLFIGLATAVAGRLVGGPAKVSIISSGLFGMISGSSIANTVTTGAFTIPMMKKIGYRAQFAGAVEATASTGGQITPPIMGAAAFVMAEFLGTPYTQIALAAVFPALLHYIGVYVQVHLEAKRYGLRGLTREELPDLKAVMRDRGYNLIPLLLLVYLLVAGFTPFTAAFWGIISAVLVDFLFGGDVPARSRGVGTAITLAAWAVLRFAFGFGAVPALFLGGAAAMAVDVITGQRGLPWRLLGIGAAVTGVLGAVLHLVFGFEQAPALFWGGIGAMAAGYVLPATRPRFSGIVDGLEWGARYALAVGAACACVGFILGTTTLTGVGFKFAVITVDLARSLAELIMPLDVFNWGIFDGATLFITLVFVAIACVVLGAGVPTTATYIILVIIAAPALRQLGVPPLVAHFFVFYYGVLADITPPVALAAYAGAGLAGSDPFKTGFTAFRLAAAKALVPFIFVYAPILLIVTPFDPEQQVLSTFVLGTLGVESLRAAWWIEFVNVFGTALIGVTALGAAATRFLYTELTRVEQVLLLVAAIGMITPETISSFAGIALYAAVAIVNYGRRKRVGAKSSVANLR